VSTRKVDDLVKTLGADRGISKSEVSRIRVELDEEVAAFTDRSLAKLTYPYVSLDVTYCQARGLGLGCSTHHLRWQRSRLHFMCKVLSVVPWNSSEMVAAAIRNIFVHPDPTHVSEQFDVISAIMRWQIPQVETMLREAKEGLLAFAGFPQAHWRQIWSTNPLERVYKEIKRRTDDVGIFPNPEALLRLAGAVLAEQHDEWAASD